MFRKFKKLIRGPVLAPSSDTTPAPTPAPGPPAPTPASVTPAPNLTPKPPLQTQPIKDEKPAVKETEAKKEEETPAPALTPAPAASPKPEEKLSKTEKEQPHAEEQEPQPSAPCPVVINRYSDAQLRKIINQMRQRTQLYKEKVIDPYTSSPEHSPPVTPVMRKKDFFKKQEEERKRKEEAERIKKEEEEAKKAATNAEEKKEKKEVKKEEGKGQVEEAKEKMLSLCPIIRCTCIDTVLKPIEDRMDKVLGTSIDSFTDRRYITWLSLVTIAFSYNLWFIPVRMTFPCHTPTSVPLWFTVDVIADLIYIIDMIIFQPRLQFCKAGDIIYDQAVIKKNYRASTKFQNAVISVIPLDLLYFPFGFQSIFRINRIMRFEAFFEFSDRLEGIMTKAYIWRVIRTIGYLLFALHINSCLYYVASAYQGIGTTKWVYSGQGNAYLRCYYFAVRTLINIGGLPEPYTVFEITFQLANFFVGVFVFSSLIGQMRDVIGAATAGETYFRASMDTCVAYMVTNRIPKLVQHRVRTWYNYTWDSQGMLDESELLEQMPLVMRTAIAVDINLAIFQKIDLFKGCDNQMLVDMLLRLKSIVYLPGDFVCKKGDIGKEMYIIKAGEVQVVGGPDNKIVFVTLKAGCVFGEIRTVMLQWTWSSSLLQSSANGGNRRTANVAAHGFANLFVLDKKELNDILVHYPESQKVLARKGRKLMKAKGPAVALKEEEKKKGIELFAPKPPTPQMLRAFGRFNKKAFMEKLKTSTNG
ncbi:cyclic nucleotide-gated cation channel beta-3 isoform X1 [Silurus meridionalis]|uniref:cyclic nucleotide-gated cation channel beta-3 isoform X1 n=1 Tax=Silurus meridionalis TaxID=175797 RepID=UPI001EEA294A|nr:cyclic nucleotide-gated cation channel beta-3 isoform X1 [Silurus meridionalis]